LRAEEEIIFSAHKPMRLHPPLSVNLFGAGREKVRTRGICFMRRATIIAGIFLLGISIGIYFVIIPWQIQYQRSTNLSPAFWPKFLMILLMIFSSILIYKNLKKEPSGEKIFDLSKSTLIRVFALPVLVLIYTHALELFGYLVSTTVGLAIMLMYFGLREFKMIIPISLGFPLLIYWFFEKVLKIAMPRGTFF